MGGETAFELFTSVRYDSNLQDVPRNADFGYAGWNFAHKSPFYMLDFHRDRLLRAATYWGWDAAIATIAGETGQKNLEQVLRDTVKDWPANEPLRCRVCLDKSGGLRCEAFAATPAPLFSLLPLQLPPPGFMASKDPVPENGDLEAPLLLSLRAELGSSPYEVKVDKDFTSPSAYTHYKTTQRQVYNDAQRRAGISGPERKEVLLVNAEKGVVMDGTMSTPYFWRNGRWVTPPVPPEYEPKNGSGGLDGTSRRWAIERGLAVQGDVKVDSLVNGEECWLSNGVRGYLYGRLSLTNDERKEMAHRNNDLQESQPTTKLDPQEHYEYT